MKQNLKRTLDNSCSLNDIFDASKIIRCRLHDIAEYLSGILADSPNTDRLSLHVQEVEAARHRAFSSIESGGSGTVDKKLIQQFDVCVFTINPLCERTVLLRQAPYGLLHNLLFVEVLIKAQHHH